MCKSIDKTHPAAKSKEVYPTIKTITRKPTIKMQSKKILTIKGKDGKTLTELEEVKTRWKENYEELYNKRNPADEETANSIPQIHNTDQEPEIMGEEIVSAINKMADGKSPGFDGITAEEIKAAGETGIDILHQLCQRIWTHETFPDD